MRRWKRRKLLLGIAILRLIHLEDVYQILREKSGFLAESSVEA